MDTRFRRVNHLLSVIEWLTDNGSDYIAHETHQFAREIGLEPLTTPVEGPQPNGMAEAFARTTKRDYARVNPMTSAEIVIRQLPAWSDHYNDLRPHKALGYRSPREFIAQHPTREDMPGL